MATRDDGKTSPFMDDPAPPGQQQLHQQQERRIAELQAALEQVQYDMRQINVVQRREIERKRIIDEQHLNPNAETADDELS